MKTISSATRYLSLSGAVLVLMLIGWLIGDMEEIKALWILYPEAVLFVSILLCALMVGFFAIGIFGKAPGSEKP